MNRRQYVGALVCVTLGGVVGGMLAGRMTVSPAMAAPADAGGGPVLKPVPPTKQGLGQRIDLRERPAPEIIRPLDLATVPQGEPIEVWGSLLRIWYERGGAEPVVLAIIDQRGSNRNCTVFTTAERIIGLLQAAVGTQQLVHVWGHEPARNLTRDDGRGRECIPDGIEMYSDSVR